MKIALCLVLSLAGAPAADFDADGVADEFAFIRDAAKEAKAAGVQLVDPWREHGAPKPGRKAPGLRIRLSREPQTYVLHDPDYFGSPMWTQDNPPLKIVTRKDPQYGALRKQVQGLKGDAVELGTEAGIDILLYWDGKQWRVYWPREEP